MQNLLGHAARITANVNDAIFTIHDIDNIMRVFVHQILYIYTATVPEAHFSAWFLGASKTDCKRSIWLVLLQFRKLLSVQKVSVFSATSME